MSTLGTAGTRRSTRHLLKANAWFVFAFLYVPIVVLVIFSFNDSERVNVWQGLSARWYSEALGNTQIVNALRVSLIVAISSTIVSTVLGTAVALALDRYRFKGRRALDGTVYLPIVIPDITMAVMLLVFLRRGVQAHRYVRPETHPGRHDSRPQPHRVQHLVCRRSGARTAGSIRPHPRRGGAVICTPRRGVRSGG